MSNRNSSGSKNGEMISTNVHKTIDTKKTVKNKKTIIPKNTLYVHNLNWKINKETLRENLYLLFSTYGEVIEIFINLKMREQAFVVFKNVDEANLAKLSLNQESFFDKPLQIEFSNKVTELD
ncbi:related to U2 small nuclear ribonucleoprotein B'' [Saccharomycodes ludwigii]|uniref:Related to U2 small nuclear ribonucleoprotein B n=1 Tax=Saccharomycodes ludwigii TaxID=36035 RepID=A0A376B8U6_9ASCO|nr:hypothetical protein SCDLUD_005197 [Saccharomycodes ludwigii]KAH3898858.1 hypothetical protein SCDLUD_005197 [Saccharomycodes ludwigii]SSD61096.1 related to U2 small nuclear ribonucleoprotein B'' [Saccharomycodes ludwigii]